MRKPKPIPKEKLVQVSGYAYDWFSYPPEWDVQAKKLQDEWEKLHEPIK